MNKYTHAFSSIYGIPWAILPERLASFVRFIDSKADGITFTKDEIDERIGAKHKPAQRSTGSVAVIPIMGTIDQHQTLMQEFFGGVSTEKVSKQITVAADDPNIKAIVLDIDSPGGTVFGVAELSKVIFEARQKKHIVAQANSLMASAAYWLGSSADKVVVTPSGEVGSIGVFTAHHDVSQFDENVGVKTTLISAGKFKTEANPFAPLSDEAREAIQSEIDHFYGMFVADVARGRGVSKGAVRNGFGQGRVLNAEAALEAGMVDGIATLDDTLASLGVSSDSNRRAMATTVTIDTEDASASGAVTLAVQEAIALALEEKQSSHSEEAVAEPKKRDISVLRKRLELAKT